MGDALILGSPSVLVAWAHAFVREAANLADNPLDVRVLDLHDDTEILTDRDSGPERLFLSNFPGPALIAKVRAGAIPVLALIDDPTDSVRFLQQQAKVSVTEALRALTLAHTIDRALFDNASVMIVHRGLAIDAAELIDLILQCLGIRLGADALRGLKERHVRAGDASQLEDMLAKNVPEWAPLEDQSSYFSADEAALVAQVLAPIVHFAFEIHPPSVVWSQKLFYLGDKPNEPPAVITDITGGARNLFYGPYLYLPPGRYRGSFVVGLSKDTRNMPFVLKVVQSAGQSILAEAHWNSPGEGIFQGGFDFNHLASDQAIEILLRNNEGAIEGRVALVHVSFDLQED